MDPYIIIEPKKPKIPFILSVPHCGTEFPDELKNHYVEDMMKAPDDTDWFVHELYNFALDKGITMIHARYSRWVIDLNRDPDSKPLYDDGRIITALTPTTDFFGNKIYHENHEPDQNEINRRLENYYWPYHKKIEKLLDEQKDEFGKAMLWDAHSIRHYVPTIRKEVFPDMILGDNDEKTASPEIIETALSGLRSGKFQINHNTPFKGGFITRNFGDPDNSIHALQLEMNKILYMDDSEKIYNPHRASKVIHLLNRTFDQLIDKLMA